MGQKEYTISIEDVKEIVHRKVFVNTFVMETGGYKYPAGSWINNEYVVKFSDDFPVRSVECEEEPIVAFENGVIRVVSSKLDKVLSVLNSKVYNK